MVPHQCCILIGMPAGTVRRIHWPAEGKFTEQNSLFKSVLSKNIGEIYHDIGFFQNTVNTLSVTLSKPCSDRVYRLSA